MSNPTHVRPAVLQQDGRFAAGIEMSDGHTVRQDSYVHLTYADAEAAAKEFFDKETATTE